MDPSDQDNGSLDLSDAIRDSLQPEGDTNTPNAAAPAAGASVIPAEPAWEPPAWTQRWKPEARDALGRFASNPELKAYYDPLKNQLEETNAYITRRDQEFGDYRKRLDPVYEALKPYEQRYALAGVPLHQGVGQLLQAAEYLNTDPDQAFAWLAGSHRPRDPQAAINQIAARWGVDIGQLVSEAPYQDPQVAALLTPLQQQVQQMQQILQQQQQGAVQQQQHALVAEISDFEAAKDDNGSPLHPHFAAVFDDMVQLVQLGKASDLPSAYKLACQLNPELQQSAIKELEEKARKKALEEANRSTAAAEKSERASRSVVGKGRTDNAKLSMSLREGFDKATAELGG